MDAAVVFRPQGDGLGRRIASTAPWTPGAGSYNPGTRPSGEPEGRPSSGLHPEAVLFPDSVHWPANLPSQATEEPRYWIKNGVVYVWNGTVYAPSTTEQPSDNEEPENEHENENEGSGEDDDEDVEEETGDEEVKENAEDNMSGEDYENDDNEEVRNEGSGEEDD